MIKLFYEICFGLASFMIIPFVLQRRGNADQEYSFMFALVPVVNLGYSWLASARSLDSALIANKLIYIGGCFLHLLLLLGVFSLCNFKLPHFVRIFFFTAAFVLFCGVLSIGHSDIFYKNVYLQVSDGYSKLIKEYGPMHNFYYVYMMILVISSLIVLIYSIIKRPEVSLKNLYILTALDVISVLVFFGGRALFTKIEIMPLFYVVAEFFFLLILHRIRLYKISTGVAVNILERGESGIICFDRAGNFLVSNETAKRIIPAMQRAKADKKPDMTDEAICKVVQSIEEFRNPVSQELVLLETEGSIYELRSDFLVDGKKTVGFYCLLLDVTKDRQYAREMEKAAEKAVAAEKAKSRFLAQMSHEIRTPINAVLGMNEMILRETDNPDILEYSDSIQTAGRTLLALINSILDFSKIEDGKMEILPVCYRTSTLISTMVNSVAERAKAKDLTLTLEADEQLPSQMLGDDVRIVQIVTNLLTNAVKYTETGGVTLTIREKRREGDRIDLFVEVKDTGIGIRKEDMGKLYESFTRLEEEKNRYIEGTGLGMPIVMGLSSAMDSRLEVESVYGEGSTFRFVLTQKIIDETPMGDYNTRTALHAHKTDSESIYAPTARILVVDDNETNLKVAKNLLKLCHIVPELVLSGKKTIEAMREREYDIVFLDHMMPEMDGVETLVELRKQGLVPEKTAMIVLTANAIVGARERYLSAGFDDYLSKPIELWRLQNILKEYLPKEKLETPPEAENTGKAGDGAGEQESNTKPAITEETDLLRLLEAAGFSTKDGLSYCVDNEIYLEILGQYEEEYDEKAGKLEASYRERNWKNYKVHAHALKSTSRTVGAKATFELAKALEHAADTLDIEFVEENHKRLLDLYFRDARHIREIRALK
ncbi:MAG: response regulator [Lachnospiraceae bacterium]|nr:response regulator [Lachnospiraceae bacterium]